MQYAQCARRVRGRLAFVALSAIGGLSLVACGSGRAVGATGQDDTQVAARVGDRTITLQEVDTRALNLSASQFSGTLQQALFDARRQVIDQIIADHLFEIEGRARGVTAARLVEQEVTDRILPVTESDVEVWYRTNPQRVQGAPLDQVRQGIHNLLARERRQVAFDVFLDRLKANHPVRIELEPPRLEINVSDDEPAVGPRSASVQIVEYSDFECPFCARASSTVRQIRETYGDRVLLVYRDFPLPNHSQAFRAAEAAQCAYEQGRFWEYHDKLFANFGRLSPEELKQHAADLGLDGQEFATCLDSGRKRQSVQQDLDEGEQYGVRATPTFFINGRPVSGAQPFEAFKQVIDEELARQ